MITLAFSLFLGQEYLRAYNAYSAALQLAPVGPTSHVFLSNRAAALLSLKRYQEAATDAKRAIALAPTFGKAHARLGQALYFLKRYDEAVQAYQDALEYEPDNEVTRTYLGKAMSKLEKQNRRKGRGSEDGISVAETDTHFTPTHSIATAAGESAIVKAAVPKQNEALRTAAGIRDAPPMGKRPPPPPPPPALQTYPPEQPIPENDVAEPDHDFEQALLLQQRANAYLTQKKYKEAIEEYTAALFLVPDDINLSTDLHLGRAHALNGCRRHESARNDAKLALKLMPSPAAYSTLAKSLFYMREYQQAIDAFQKCKDMLPEGEDLGLFDQAYLRKARAAMEEEEYSLAAAGTVSSRDEKPVPKLPPPRFVPREAALQQTPTLPSRPKNWPVQTVAESPLKVGPERAVIFLSEALGMKLNRGPDGMVRVLSVTPASGSSQVARQGEIEVGDIIREAAGVDLRRPITNIMWGDTVALIRMAPRPIMFVVAAELSPVPPEVLKEQQSSPSSTEESVAQQIEDMKLIQTSIRHDDQQGESQFSSASVENVDQVLATDDSVPCSDRMYQMSVNDEDANAVDINENPTSIDDVVAAMEDLPLVKDEEMREEGSEVLFLRDALPTYGGWDNLRWMSYSGIRKVNYCSQVYRMVDVERKNLFWTTTEEHFVERRLVIYEEPGVILLMRRALNLEEIRGILDLTEEEGGIGDQLLDRYWLVEAVVDPATAKLKLSFLTTKTSAVPENSSDRAKSCFAILSPLETIMMTVIGPRCEASRDLLTDGEAFLDTCTVELALSKAIVRAHEGARDEILGSDLMWKHQVIIGTLHSAIVSGNHRMLEQAIEAIGRCNAAVRSLSQSSEIDLLDDIGMPPLYYACRLGMTKAVEALIKAGADVDLRTESDNSSYLHICARNLDDKTMAVILSSPNRPDPNSMNLYGRKPYYVAATEGRSSQGNHNSAALGRCLALMNAANATMDFSEVVQVLACDWRYMDLSVVLEFSCYRFPLPSERSLAAFYRYPLHHALLSLQSLDAVRSESDLTGTLDVLVNHGFEPNERLDFIFPLSESFPSTFVGFTPLQILGYIAFNMRNGQASSTDSKIDILKLVSTAAENLVRHGGRLAIDAPPSSRPRSTSSSSRADAENSLDALRKQSKEAFFSANSLVTILGCEDQLGIARETWLSLKPIHKLSFVPLATDTKLPLQISSEAGGCDSKSCAICWRVFGTLVNRQHRCRVTKRYVCDDCSSKRVSNGAGEHRVTDGQFLLVQADCQLRNALPSQTPPTVQINTPSLSDRAAALPEAISAVRKERMIAEEQANRESLFGGVLEHASRAVFGVAEPLRVTDKTQELNTSLNETRNALLDRGKKLESLGEKSSQMVDASADFARMAKELRRKTEGGLFW